MIRIGVFPSLRHEVDRLFDSLVHSAWASRPGEPSWMPPTDVLEDLDLYRIEIDVPGVPASNISITAEGHSLKVAGVRERSASRARHHMLERSTGRFERNFHVPDDADLETIGARLDDGVLMIEIAKRKGGRTR